jgi:hypothetical protein
MAEESQATILIPIKEAVFQDDSSVSGVFKYRYRLNLNPGTSRHMLESTDEIRIQGLPGDNSGEPELLMKVKGTTRVTHEEGDHAPIYLPEGTYKSRVLLEFDPWTESSIAVFD